MNNAYFASMGDSKFFRVLVVDDDKDILDLLEYNFRKEGFKVKTLEDSRNAITEAKTFQPDLIILDIMMPYFNGFEICRELRTIKRFKDTYIFFLTAKSDHHYQQEAFTTGGDDFIEKVIGLRALTNKVNTVLKKNFIIRKGIDELEVGNLKIHRKSSSVTIGNHEISLSHPEFELLFFLAQNPGKTITQEHLLHNIWGSEVYLFETSLDTYIQSLQKKLGLNLIQQANNRYKLMG